MNPKHNKDISYDYDLIVVGAGSGGLAAARKASSLGAKTAIIEEKSIGGTCVNNGCIPKKLMFNAADIADTLKLLPHYGYDSVGLKPLTPSLVAAEMEAMMESASVLAKEKTHKRARSSIGKESTSPSLAPSSENQNSLLHPSSATPDSNLSNDQMKAHHHHHHKRKSSIDGGSSIHIPDGRVFEHLSDDQKRLLLDEGCLAQVAFDWHILKRIKDDYIRHLHAIYTTALEREKVDYIRDQAELISPREIKIKGSGKILRTKYIIIATGAHPNIPSNIPGYEYGITSDDFFTLERQPKRVAIVGGGYIGVELAGILQSLGSLVHLWVRGPQILTRFDSTISDVLHEEMIKTGILLQTSCQIMNVEKTSGEKGDILHVDLVKNVDGKDIRFQVDVDTLIWAVGRNPNTESLGLESLKIKLDSHGSIIVNEQGQTSCENIYAIGDVTTHRKLTPVAIASGRILAEYLFGKRKNLIMEFSLIPTVVFSHPPIGSIGMTESEALQKYEHDEETRKAGLVKVYYHKFTNLKYGLLPPGHRDRRLSLYKVITVKEPVPKLDNLSSSEIGNEDLEEKVVGIHIIGYGSDEILQGFAVAMKKGLTKADLDCTIPIHPTSAEELLLLK